MVQTTDVLSILTNRVLTECGERASASITTPSAAKAVSALKDTFIEITNATDWRWTKQRVQADSWSDEKATFERGFQRLLQVTYLDSHNRHRPLNHVQETQFYNGTIREALNGDTLNNYYSVTGYGEVSIAYYPGTTEEQNKYFFTIVQDPQIPTEASDTFPMPDRFVTALVKGACAKFCLVQFEEDARVRQFQQEYQLLINQLIQRERADNKPGGRSWFSHLKRRR